MTEMPLSESKIANNYCEKTFNIDIFVNEIDPGSTASSADFRKTNLPLVLLTLWVAFLFQFDET